MTGRQRPPRLRSAAWAVGLAFAAATGARADEPVTLADNFSRALPPASGAAKQGTLYLELVVNELSTGRIVPVRYRDGMYFVRAGDLAQASVRTNADPDTLVDLSKLDGVEVEYESAEQRLKLTVPADWLPSQTIGSRRLYDRTPAAVNFGILFNYDIYTSSPTLGTSYTSAWTEARMFDKWGTVTTTGVYRRDYGGNGGIASNRYLRYDTTWRYSDQDRMLTYTAGDLVTGALSWSSAVRLGGVSIERNFRVRPDIVTYPLPQFSGQAAVPTAVDLFINGSKTTSGQVNPGPFTLNNVPFINGAGEATVVTTDALGRQVATTIPFYVANTLLQKGLSDYSLSVGAMRRDYGIRSFSYGKFAVSGTARYGLTDYLTIEGHAEGGERLALGGVGFDLGVGMFGVFNFAATQSSFAGASGQQYAFGYSYSSQRASLSLQRIQRTGNYGDLSVYDLPSDVRYRLVRSSTQATGALNLGAIGGTLGAGYFDVRGMDGSRTRIANLSYTRPIFNRATIYASLNKTIGERSVAAQVQLILPFGDKGVVTGSVARDERNNWSERVQYSRSVPSDGGFGWNLAYGGGNSHYQQADATWRNRYFEVQGGAYGYGGGQSYTRWGEVQGSLVVMDGAVMPANRVDDAFVLISTQGRKGVPVRYENQLVGATDGSGHLLVPWAPSYYAGKYEIDPLGLPSNMRVPVVERRVAVRERAGALVSFPVEKIVSARIALVDGSGKPIKVGARVLHEESGQTALVGWGGETYFEGLSAVNHLRVTLPGGGQCRAMFDTDVNAAQMNRVGPLGCSE
ncbi:fimbrial assembly protein [Burkholderia singularis]|uniref:Fimbrial assembly protein n=1 Tax=Burkholderia singularis TaxID=1503053 RepID=A0A103E6I7_9BURK|nr:MULTISPECIES: fimbria/pilus outer membrane usher protein [Burkholderia]AOK30023.1 fimbrial assembly protein [Burkholderia sp. Bp7605]KVE29280.1 fimbrial assembly protein [Burkholderia singularis]